MLYCCPLCVVAAVFVFGLLLMCVRCCVVFVLMSFVGVPVLFCVVYVMVCMCVLLMVLCVVVVVCCSCCVLLWCGV